MRIFAYTRVSTADQANEGESLATQKQRIEGYAAGQGWQVDQTYCDKAVSGSRRLTDRPEGAKLLAEVQAGDVVIATKLDRIFRSATDALNALEDFEGRGIRLVLLDMGGEVTSGGISGLIFTIMSGVAKFERERIMERAAEVKASLKEQGRATGPAPWGFYADDQGYLQRDPQTAPGRDLALMLAAEGLSARKIHARLLEAGYSVSLPTVSKIAKNARAEAA